ncbi:MAG: SDR family NAD(P)-dependent oxidoreductase [Holosporales bacterium]
MSHYWLIGASEGIGASLALRLARDGIRLTLSARNTERLEDVRANLPGTGHRAVSIDVTDTASVLKAWAEVGAVDGVIYNAGAYQPMDAQHWNLPTIEQMLDVNFRGALRVLTSVVPDFLGRNAGHIVLVASVAGYRGLPAAIGYGASKAALIHLAENLKADLDGTAVKVQVINPGFVKTRLTAKNDFPMPCMISAEKAADYIASGMKSARFEVHFPRRFSLLLKALGLLPHGAYFWVLRQLHRS